MGKRRRQEERKSNPPLHVCTDPLFRCSFVCRPSCSVAVTVASQRGDADQPSRAEQTSDTRTRTHAHTAQTRTTDKIPQPIVRMDTYA